MKTYDVHEFIKNGLIKSKDYTGWTFYYDETNNYRKFKLDPSKVSGYNDERAISNEFILGGIVLPPDVNPNYEDLKKKIKLKDDSELKSKYFMRTGDFIKDISSERVNIFLNWILDNDLFIHYVSENNLYYSIIDLVDEIFEHKNGEILIPFHKTIKEEVFDFAMEHLIEFTSILLQYGYPSIDDDKIYNFCSDLSDLIKSYSLQNTISNFGLECFRQCINSIKNDKKLYLLTDEKKLMLIETYIYTYFDSIFHFPTAYHIFDKEYEIEKRSEEYELKEYEKPYDRFEFRNSKSEFTIQISDAFIGILGKYFYFADLVYYDCSLKDQLITNDDAVENLSLLNKIILKSEKLDYRFIKAVTSEKLRNNRYELLNEMSYLHMIYHN